MFTRIPASFGNLCWVTGPPLASLTSGNHCRKFEEWADHPIFHDGEGHDLGSSGVERYGFVWLVVSMLKGSSFDPPLNSNDRQLLQPKASSMDPKKKCLRLHPMHVPL